MKKLLLAAGLMALCSPSVAAEPNSTSPAPGEKMRCKRVGETGSNVRHQKVCRTEREWKMLRDKGRQEAGDLANPSGGMKTSG